MVRIFVNDDVVAVPEPIAAEANVIRGYAEIEAAEPETVGTASGEMSDVAAAEAAGKASVLPGMIEVVVRVVAARVMANPFAVRMDVRRVGMSGLVVEVRSRRHRMFNRSRPMGGDVPDTVADVMTLREGYKAKQEANCHHSNEFFHVHPFCERPEDFTVGGRLRAIRQKWVSGQCSVTS